MKLVYYRTLLKKNCGLTFHEKILYSFLVSKSIERLDLVFSQEGKFMPEVADCYNYKNYFPLLDISHSKIAKELHVSRQSVISWMCILKERRFILNYNDKDLIYIDPLLFKEGFFNLIGVGELNGELLVFYSYLYHKSKRYNFKIDTYIYKLSEEFGVCENAVKMLLRKLKKAGFVSRDENHKLIIRV